MQISINVTKKTFEKFPISQNTHHALELKKLILNVSNCCYSFAKIYLNQ